MDNTGILSVSMSWVHVRVIIWTLLFVGTCTSMGPCCGISCLIGCGIPPSLYEEHHITTSERKNGYRIGDQIVYHCEKNYVNTGGSSESRCTTQGTWTTPTLRCKIEGGMLPEGQINWTVETPSSKSQDNQGEPHQKGGGSSVIGPGLAYNEICGEPPKPSGPHSVRFKVGHPHASGSRVSYGCKSGYKYISGPTYSRCRRHGAWDPEVIEIKCEEKGCVLPTLPGKDQTSQSDIYRVGTNITFSCREGYELIGESLQICQEDETWSNMHPRCVPSKCGTPTQPHYGRIKPHQHSYVYGSDVRYVCNQGYRVVGDTYRTCLGDKTWSGKLPTCQVMDCGFPNVPHADIFLLHNTTTYPSVAQIKCRTGASHQSFCNRKGKWHPHVKCKESQNTPEPTIVDDLFTTAQHSLDSREFSTQSKNYDPGVYQESVSSGYRTHLMWPLTLLPLILYSIITHWI